MRATTPLPQVHSVANEIAILLGHEWSMRAGNQDNLCDAFLDGPDSVSIHLLLEPYGRNPRWKISGQFGHACEHIPPGEKSSHSIGMAPSRTAPQMAAEIKRRLLPEYTQVLALAVARQKEWESEIAEREALTDQLTGILRGHRPKHGPTHSGEFGSVSTSDGSFRVLGGTVEFKVEVPRRLADTLARAIAELVAADKVKHA